MAFQKTPKVDTLRDTAKAFEAEWDAQADLLANSPITAFLAYHDKAGTPDNHTVAGVGDVRVTLGDLKQFVRAVS